MNTNNQSNQGLPQKKGRGAAKGIPIVFAPEEEFFPALKSREEKRRAAREIGLDLIRVYTKGEK